MLKRRRGDRGLKELKESRESRSSKQVEKEAPARDVRHSCALRYEEWASRTEGGYRIRVGVWREARKTGEGNWRESTRIGTIEAVRAVRYSGGKRLVAWDTKEKSNRGGEKGKKTRPGQRTTQKQVRRTKTKEEKAAGGDGKEGSNKGENGTVGPGDGSKKS